MNRPVPDPFLARTAWWIPEPLDRSRLRLGADPFVGEHDFASFCKRPADNATRVRRVISSEWRDLGDGLLRYDVRATSFCWQMVRSLVGTMVDAGLGRRRPGELLTLLRQRDRKEAATPAPPHGLCLWEVGYDT